MKSAYEVTGGVTGAGAGIGQTAALLFVEGGARAVITGGRFEPLDFGFMTLFDYVEPRRTPQAVLSMGAMRPLAGFNLVAALISYPAGSLSDKWGRRNILLASFVIFFVAYLGFARTRTVVVIAVLFIFYGLFQGIFRSVGKALASDFVPELLRASAVGWYSAVVGLLGLVASVVAGLLWGHVSHAAVFYYGSIFAIAGSVGLLLIPEKRHRSAVEASSAPRK